jgi:hypothetical protein
MGIGAAAGALGYGAGMAFSKFVAPRLMNSMMGALAKTSPGSLSSKILGGGMKILSRATGTSLPDNTFVIRGGLNSPGTVEAALTKGGISVRSAPGATVEQLAEGLPHTRIGVTTVKDIRAVGGNVIPSNDVGNPYHATIIPGPGGTEELSGLFNIQPNPWVSP